MAIKNIVETRHASSLQNNIILIFEGEEETGLKLKPLYCINIGELIYNPEFAWMDPKEVLEQKLNFSDGIEKSVYNFINGIKFNIESSNFKK